MEYCRCRHRICMCVRPHILITGEQWKIFETYVPSAWHRRAIAHADPEIMMRTQRKLSYLAERAGGRAGVQMEDKGHNRVLGKCLPYYVQVNLKRYLRIQALKFLFLTGWWPTDENDSLLQFVLKVEFYLLYNPTHALFTLKTQLLQRLKPIKC
jgi:hypothetical protein